MFVALVIFLTLNFKDIVEHKKNVLRLKSTKNIKCVLQKAKNIKSRKLKQPLTEQHNELRLQFIREHIQWKKNEGVLSLRVKRSSI